MDILNKAIEMNGKQANIISVNAKMLVKPILDSYKDSVNFNNLYTYAQIEEGNIVAIEGINYIVLEKENNLVDTYNKCTITKAQFIIWKEQKIFGYVRSLKDVVVNNQYFGVVADEIEITIPYMNDIDINDIVSYNNKNFKIQSIDDTKENLLTFVAKFNTENPIHFEIVAPKEITLIEGKYTNVKVECKVNGVTDNKALYNINSNDTTVCTIDYDGNIRAIGEGTTTIIIVWEDINTKINVTVKAKDKPKPIEPPKPENYKHYEGESLVCEDTLVGATKNMIIKGKTVLKDGKLVSAGQTNNKISISSHGKNLFDFFKQEWRKGGAFEPSYGVTEGITVANGYLKLTKPASCVGCTLQLKPNTTYRISSKITNSSTMFVRNFNISEGETITTDDSGLLRFGVGVYNLNTNSGYVLIENIQIEEKTETTSSSYQPYKSFKKDILLPFEGGLKGIGSVCDELNSNTRKIIKKIEKRAYKAGDELLDNVITDKVNTYYVLDTPVEYNLYTNINIDTFQGITYINFENENKGVFSCDVEIVDSGDSGDSKEEPIEPIDPEPVEPQPKPTEPEKPIVPEEPKEDFTGTFKINGKLDKLKNGQSCTYELAPARKTVKWFIDEKYKNDIEIVNEEEGKITLKGITDTMSYVRLIAQTPDGIQLAMKPIMVF